MNKTVTTPFNGDEEINAIFTSHKISRCVIPWENTQPGQFFLLDFEGRKNAPSVPERLKQKGYQYEYAKLDGVFYQGRKRSGWLFKRIK